MHGPDISDASYLPQRVKIGNQRYIITLVLSLIILLAGSLISTYTITQAATAQHTLHRANSALVVRTTPTIPPTSTPLTATPTPTARPTPSPTPTPISPFPTSLAQQIAALQAHNRFFYGGNPSLPEIALTFDDGPNPPYTLQILNILRRYGVKATFFCMGLHVQQFPAVVQQEYAEGHLVENHSWSHPYMPYLSTASVIWQLSTTQDIIQHTVGVRPIFFRPPYGAFNSTVLTYANYFGLTTVLWNVDPRDWSMPGTNVIYTRVLAQTRPGSIILMHDGGGDRSQTVAALPQIIVWFQSHGYRFVTLQQLINDTHQNPTQPITNTVKNTQIDMWRRNWQVRQRQLCLQNIDPEDVSICSHSL